jgi:hypothetical protein
VKKSQKIAVAALLPAALAVSAGVAVNAEASPAHGAAAANAAGTAHHTAAHKPAPRKTAQWVTVRAGQTLKSIAAAHHMPWQAIYATPPNTQHLRGHATLTPGEHLRIPADPRLRVAEYWAMRHRQEVRHAEAVKRREAAAAAAQANTAAQQSTASQPLTAGMSAYEKCVAWRESSDTPTDPDGLFGILPSTWASLGYSGTAGQASVAQQKVAFNRLYAEYGTQPWSPSDGC